MRKYNRRILTALVVAYKKGIINRKPLNKWLNFDQVLYRTLKYISYLLLFSMLFLVLENNVFKDFKIDGTVIISGYIIEKSRIIAGIVVGFLALNIYRLWKYLSQVYFVKKAMKEYKFKDNDVEKLNSITFKIHV